MSDRPMQCDYTIRRKVFTLFGAKFHIFDAQGNTVGFSQQKAFRLKEDLRVYTDETKTKELMAIVARQVIDFSASYDVFDSGSSAKVGALRRKGFASFLRDSWTVLDANDQPIGTIKEDSMGMAMLRRFVPLGNLVPQKFHLGTEQGDVFAEYRTQFNPIVHKMQVSVHRDCPVSSSVVLASAILLVAIEGRQDG